MEYNNLYILCGIWYNIDCNYIMTRKATYIKEAFTDDELRSIIKTIRQSKNYPDSLSGLFQRKRDETILLFACYTGLRPREILQLKWEDLDFEEKKIYVRPENNKNRETMSALINKTAEDLICKYKELCSQFTNLKYIFPSLITLQPLEVNSYDKKLLALQRESGIYKIRYINSRGTPMAAKSLYSARKYYGTKFYQNTKDIHKLKRALRHKHLYSSEPYVTISTDDILIDLNKTFSKFN